MYLVHRTSYFKVMNITEVKQHIKVDAVFENELISPKWFKWVNKKFDIKKINMRWKSFSGNAILTHFSVTAGNNLYEITFNQKSLEWMLDKVGTE